MGDTTILANRSLYVDFTLPYTESGVSMVVPTIDKRKKNAWVFLKPLTWDLWVTSSCLFVFIGFVIWVLEHRVNKDFRGPRSHQVGTIFWFSFSTLVFTQSNFSSTSLNLNAQYIYVACWEMPIRFWNFIIRLENITEPIPSILENTPYVISLQIDVFLLIFFCILN